MAWDGWCQKAPSYVRYLQIFCLCISIRGGVTPGRMAQGPCSFDVLVKFSFMSLFCLCYDYMLHPSKLAGGSGTLISLHMIDLTTGWALGEHAVLRTSDGGLQWKNVAPPNSVLTRESIADFLTASLAWVATPQVNGTTTQILRTIDGGQTWQQSTIQEIFLKQITFIDSQHGWILSGWGATGGAAEVVGVFRTGDGGKTWSNVSSALPASTDIPPPGHLPFGGRKSDTIPSCV